MDIDVELVCRSIGEEDFPERSKVEIGIGEEEKGDFGFRVCGAEAGLGGGERSVRRRDGGGFAEEGEVVEVVRERDGEGARREEVGDEEEEERERE